MSVVVLATILPAPEHRAEVVAAFEDAIGGVHEEPGCELYALQEGPDRLVMIEKWASAEALEVHQQAEALRRLGSALQGKLTAPLDVQVLSPHPAGDHDKGVV